VIDIRRIISCVIQIIILLINIYIYNNFYASVFITDNNVLPYCHSRVNDDCFICDVLFPPDRVFSLLTKFKPRTSGGPDGLSALFLKMLLVH